MPCLNGAVEPTPSTANRIQSQTLHLYHRPIIRPSTGESLRDLLLPRECEWLASTSSANLGTSVTVRLVVPLPLDHSLTVWLLLSIDGPEKNANSSERGSVSFSFGERTPVNYGSPSRPPSLIHDTSSESDESDGFIARISGSLDAMSVSPRRDLAHSERLASVPHPPQTRSTRTARSANTDHSGAQAARHRAHVGAGIGKVRKDSVGRMRVERRDESSLSSDGCLGGFW